MGMIVFRPDKEKEEGWHDHCPSPYVRTEEEQKEYEEYFSEERVLQRTEEAIALGEAMGEAYAAEIKRLQAEGKTEALEDEDKVSPE